jgi:hypothetical protein
MTEERQGELEQAYIQLLDKAKINKCSELVHLMTWMAKEVGERVTRDTQVNPWESVREGDNEFLRLMQLSYMSFKDIAEELEKRGQ